MQCFVINNFTNFSSMWNRENIFNIIIWLLQALKETCGSSMKLWNTCFLFWKLGLELESPLPHSRKKSSNIQSSSLPPSRWASLEGGISYFGSVDTGRLRTTWQLGSNHGNGWHKTFILCQFVFRNGITASGKLKLYIMASSITIILGVDFGQ